MGQQVRTVRATLDAMESAWRDLQRARRSQGLPAPTPTAVAMAITVLEVQAGLRPPHQLEGFSHYTLWRAWSRLPEPRDHPAPIVPRPLAVTIREVTPGLVDATVVVDFAGHPRPLALRLDGAVGFWQLLELDYPVAQGVPGPRRIHAFPPAMDEERDALRLVRPADILDRSSAPEATGQAPRGDLHLPPRPDEGMGIEFE